MTVNTVVSIEGDRFLINGELTYPGTKIEGRLMNSRMVQATFDDLNPETRGRWDRPGRPWDAERNTDAFIAELATYRSHGLLAFTTNFQGGSPEGYSREQPWHNSGFGADGTLREDYAARMGRVIDAADALGMVVIVGLFYFGQDERLADEAAVCRACDDVVDWLIGRGDRNVMIEVANEVDLDRGVPGKSFYERDIIRVERGDELITRVQQRSAGKLDTPADRLLVSTSQYGQQPVDPQIAGVADFILLHGNGPEGPDNIRNQVALTRQVKNFRGQPIVFNEDDHFKFDEDDNHLRAAVESGASWGFFDYRIEGEGDAQGYQSVPTDWSISSERKRGFFDALKALANQKA